MSHILSSYAFVVRETSFLIRLCPRLWSRKSVLYSMLWNTNSIRDTETKRHCQGWASVSRCEGDNSSKREVRDSSESRRWWRWHLRKMKTYSAWKVWHAEENHGLQFVWTYCNPHNMIVQPKEVKPSCTLDGSQQEGQKQKPLPNAHSVKWCIGAEV